MEEEREGRLFPDKNEKVKITCHDMTTEFLIYGTDVCIEYLIYLELSSLILLPVMMYCIIDWRH